MPIKKRHHVISLGSFSGNSIEIDASSFDWGVVMVEQGGLNSQVSVEASPQPFGETATWYVVGETITVAADENWAWPIPAFTYSQQYVPSRIRIVAQNTADIWVELIREIG